MPIAAGIHTVAWQSLCVTDIDLDELLSSPLPEALQVFAFYTGKEKQNALARTRLDALGYVES